MDQFNSWHIDIQTNVNALNGTSIDHSTENIFPPSTLFYNAADCINGGVPGANSNCQTGEDGLGIVHVEGTVLGQPSAPPHSGILFSINFLAGSLNFTNIHFVRGDIIDPAISPPFVTHDTFDSVYGTPPVPDFSISLKDQSLSMTPGSSVNTTVTVSSVNAFSGQVNFTSTTVAS